MGWQEGLIEDSAETLLRLLKWSGPWPSGDPDANFKSDVAGYSKADPLLTVKNLARNLDIPVGAVVRYILARWVTAGSETVLELGPSRIEAMLQILAEAEQAGTDEARLAAYDQIREQLQWLGHGLNDPETTYPSGGAGT